MSFQGRGLALLLGVAALLLGPVSAFATEEAPAPLDRTGGAASVFMLDDATGTILLAKEPDLAVPPASLSKLMTAELVFAALEAGRIELSTPVKITEDAWRRGGGPSGGSAMFAELNSEVAVSDLLRGMIVQSGNDAAISLAAAVAGDEPTFAAAMNERAAELGLSNSRFANATGLPDPEAKVTMRDMVKLARHIRTAYPAAYGIFSEPEFTWNNIRQRNRNPLLKPETGVDGLMTGFTEASGFGAVVSSQRGSRRVYLAASGYESAEARQRGLAELIEWAFTGFRQRPLFDAGETVAEAAVFGGMAGSVALVTPRAISLLLPEGQEGEARANVVYRGPLKAPVTAAETVAKLLISLDGTVIADFPLETAVAVEASSMTSRAADVVLEHAFGWMR
ncbi:MAG: D-alanyl-D-alanine carboxypeptidase [Rhizobiaceae bacterium]|jgi:D-alanyl-D-alanine carboxypeptidase (penicillin-binding protein 5/6)|nr:D-alanyl-D-alanine carboxypeptidase [Rhizobiaceae bacterium]